jgi:glycosyltransferase involved in cell wall biosynthesis
MRILHVDKMLFSPSGVSSYVRRLAQLQRQAGHQVHVFTCRLDSSPIDDTFPPYVDFKARHRSTDLWQMIHNSLAAKLLGRFLNDHPVDVAHVHNLYHHLTPSVLGVLGRRGVPTVMTVHDYRLACPTRHFLRPDGLCSRCWPHRLYHAASPRCAGWVGAALAMETAVQRWLGRYRRHVGVFLCPTEFMRRIVCGLAIPRSRAAVFRNVVDDISELPPAPVDCDTVLFAGRLSDEKGPQRMLDLARRLDWVKVVLAGDGPCRQSLAEQVRGEDLANVAMPGHVSQPQLLHYLSAAAAVVMPSRAMENSPQIMLEAMLAGRCVIVPDQPPLREWVQDGRTGRLFACDDTQSLVKVVQEVLADPPGRQAMCRRARELVLQRHDPQRLLSQVQSHYQCASRLCASR